MRKNTRKSYNWGGKVKTNEKDLFDYLCKAHRTRAKTRKKQCESFKNGLNDIKHHFKSGKYSLDYHAYLALTRSLNDPYSFNAALYEMGLTVKFCSKRLTLLIKPRKKNA